MQYKVKGSSRTHPVVQFRCDQCHSVLKALLAEAGAKMECPSCNVLVQVPGTRERAEWKRDRAAEAREQKQDRQAAAPGRAAQQQAQPPLPDEPAQPAPAVAAAATGTVCPRAEDRSLTRQTNERMIAFASSYVAWVGRFATIILGALWGFSVIASLLLWLSFDRWSASECIGGIVGSGALLWLLWIGIRVSCGLAASLCEVGLMANRRLQGKL
jgi:phage FluMu protein Com